VLCSLRLPQEVDNGTHSMCANSQLCQDTRCRFNGQSGLIILAYATRDLACVVDSTVQGLCTAVNIKASDGVQQ